MHALQQLAGFFGGVMAGVTGQYCWDLLRKTGW